jgi:predicted membrane protein (TIGR00267 family)
MLREELGLGNEAFESPLTIGITMGVSFLAGAVIPILPYFFLATHAALITASTASISFLFALGAFKTRLTKTNWLRSGLEMLGIGAVSALIGYVVGLFVSRLTTPGL